MPDDSNPLLPLGDSPTPPGDGDGKASLGPGAAHFIPINIEDEMKRSYLDYAMSVIIGRALPDVRDGLKPVHRRILYAMHDMGLLYNRKHVKCAKVVGECLGKYHPHGDGPLYDSLVRMAQNFSLRYPLIDGQGNFGSVDGDPPAAYRYTECRITRIAEELLVDIDRETVDFVENFDNTTMEPTVLPTRVPNLLINGSNGIAVGMATNIPPHNLTEIVDATIALVNNPVTSLQDILKIVKGPDFPTGAYIYGRAGIEQAYVSGRGRFTMRAKVATEKLGKDRESLIITEIPYQVNKARLIERIADLVNEKIIDEISDIRDESDRDGMRVVIELKRTAEPQIVLNQLYKHTSMQEGFSMIFLAVVNGQPKEMGLIAAIRHFIDHRVEVVRRRTVFLLAKAREREHILEGYRIALDRLDAVIKLIRGSKSRVEAREGLVTSFALSVRQSDAILDLQLHRLTQLAKEEIINELGEIQKNIAEYESILASDRKLRGVIVKELEEVKKEYGGAKDQRRTILQDETAELTLEDLISDEQVAVTFSHSGYLKRTPISIYRQQRRGGTGRKGMSTREEDFVEQMFIASTHAYILVFTNAGRVYWQKVYELPDVGPAGKGKSINNLIALQPGETVRTLLAVRNLEEEGKYVFFATRKGTVKKTPLGDFSNVSSRGIMAIGIDPDDELVAVRLTDGHQIVFLASHEGQAIRFEEADVRSMGRPAFGVRGMALDRGDYIVGMATTPDLSAGNNAKAGAKAKTDKDKPVDAEEVIVVAASNARLILSVTENGYGKRTHVDEYRLQSRGGKGVINVKTTARNGKVSGIVLVDENTEAMVISQFGKIIRIDTNSIRSAGRSTQGVRLLHLDEGDKVAAAVVIPPEEKVANGGNGGGQLLQ